MSNSSKNGSENAESSSTSSKVKSIHQKNVIPNLLYLKTITMRNQKKKEIQKKIRNKKVIKDI